MKTYKKYLYFCLALLLIILGITGCSDKTDTAIETVKNGYLGEYTDMTISEFLEGYYSLMMYDDIEWGGGTTDNDELLVQVKFSDTDEIFDPVTIQFTMLDEDCFEVTAMVDPAMSTKQPTDVAALLNYAYYMQYVLQHEEIVGDFDAELAFIEKLNSISGASVLYGASKDYTGNRSQLYKLFNASPLDVGVAWMLDSYDLLDMGYYVSGGSENTITFDTELYSLELPEYWEDLAVYEQWDIGYAYGITFYESQSLDDFDGEGGMLFSIILDSNDEYMDYPDYTYLGQLSVVRLANFDVVVTYPTDVQFSDAGQENYMKLSNDIAGILASFTPQPDVDCEYTPAT